MIDHIVDLWPCRTTAWALRRPVQNPHGQGAPGCSPTTAHNAYRGLYYRSRLAIITVLKRDHGKRCGGISTQGHIKHASFSVSLLRQHRPALKESFPSAPHLVVRSYM